MRRRAGSDLECAVLAVESEAGSLLMKSDALAPFVASVLLAGCSTVPGVRPEKGPQGTIAYFIQVESSEPGARVEVNEDIVGKTPLQVRVWGDRDGTFHNFGSSDFILRVFPVREGQSVQTKVFRTGGWFSQEDRVPSSLFFDLNQKSTGGFSVEPGKPRY